MSLFWWWFSEISIIDFCEVCVFSLVFVLSFRLTFHFNPNEWLKFLFCESARQPNDRPEEWNRYNKNYPNTHPFKCSATYSFTLDSIPLSAFGQYTAIKLHFHVRRFLLSFFFNTQCGSINSIALLFPLLIIRIRAPAMSCIHVYGNERIFVKRTYDFCFVFFFVFAPKGAFKFDMLCHH